MNVGKLTCCALTLAGLIRAQGAITVKLEDALARARQYGGQIQTANSAVLQAREDTAQTRAARLPSVNAFNQFIYTQGNGTPSGVFVANDGVHIYNEQAVVHEEVLAFVRHGEMNRALALEAIARAKVEVAARGLNATVIQNYFAIVSAQRKVANLQRSVQEAERFLDITQKLEKGGETAHADVIKAQIDLQQRQRDLKDAQYAIEKSKIALGVLIFPNFSSDFSVVDDLQQPAMLPAIAEAQAQATASSPDIKAASAGLQETGYEVNVAKYGYLPSFGLDFFYGIDANQFAAHTDYPTQATGRSTLPNFEVTGRQNLGYVAQATLNIPVWNWGATRSKIKQAELKRDQAQLDLSLTQRNLQASLAAAYTEAQAAQSQLDSLRSSADLAAESLRLTLLRYQAGEATALEVVDAQNTVNLSRNAQDDGLARYRVALANLQSLMGTL
ncbi:MAG TPA: TolC family protein [Bryobacteraceae bacterium]|nr:TolC family protein [Bryobacteraceae bacterium]